MISREDVALCWGSLHETDLQSLAEQAANAGFTGITLNTALFDDAIAAGLSAQDINSRLTDLGLTVSNIDPLFSWMPGAPGIPGEDVIARSSRASIDEVYTLHAIYRDRIVLERAGELMNYYLDDHLRKGKSH